MITDELNIIQTGMIAVADSFDLDFDTLAVMGDGNDGSDSFASRCSEPSTNCPRSFSSCGVIVGVELKDKG
jgi:hypothetical protein